MSAAQASFVGECTLMARKTTKVATESPLEQGGQYRKEGRFEEAEQIARQTLSPAQAEANIAFLRSMLASEDAWARLAAGEGAI